MNTARYVSGTSSRMRWTHPHQRLVTNIRSEHETCRVVEVYLLKRPVPPHRWFASTACDLYRVCLALAAHCKQDTCDVSGVFHATRIAFVNIADPIGYFNIEPPERCCSYTHSLTPSRRRLIQ